MLRKIKLVSENIELKRENDELVLENYHLTKELQQLRNIVSSIKKEVQTNQYNSLNNFTSKISRIISDYQSND